MRVGPAFLAVLLLAPPAAACTQRVAEDGVGDVTAFNAVPYDAAFLDLRRLQLDSLPRALRFTLDVAASPVGRDDAHASYTIRFGDGARELVLHVGGAGTYEEATLAGGGAHSRTYGTTPVAWNGTRMEMVLPRDAVAGIWGRPANATWITPRTRACRTSACSRSSRSSSWPRRSRVGDERA